MLGVNSVCLLLAWWLFVCRLWTLSQTYCKMRTAACSLQTVAAIRRCSGSSHVSNQTMFGVLKRCQLRLKGLYHCAWRASRPAARSLQSAYFLPNTTPSPCIVPGFVCIYALRALIDAKDPPFPAEYTFPAADAASPPLVIRVRSVPSRMTSHADVGNILWPAAIMQSRWLLAHPYVPPCRVVVDMLLLLLLLLFAVGF